MAKAKAASAPETNPKKAYRKTIAVAMEAVLQGLKEKLGEEEFHRRLKKAVKVLAHGLSEETTPKKIKAPKVSKTPAPVKKAKAVKRGRPRK